MNVGTIIFLIVYFIADRIVHKKFPRFYKRMELPINIIFSVLITVYCAFLIYAVYNVLISSVAIDSKIFFVIFIGIIISGYVAIVTFTWRRWLRGRKQNL